MHENKTLAIPIPGYAVFPLTHTQLRTHVTPALGILDLGDKTCSHEAQTCPGCVPLPQHGALMSCQKHLFGIHQQGYSRKATV